MHSKKSLRNKSHYCIGPTLFDDAATQWVQTFSRGAMFMRYSYIFSVLNQNWICDCLLISVFLPKFTWSEPKNGYGLMLRTISGSDQINSGKNTVINKQLYVKFWFNRKNMELAHIYLSLALQLFRNAIFFSNLQRVFARFLCIEFSKVFWQKKYFTHFESRYD